MNKRKLYILLITVLLFDFTANSQDLKNTVELNNNDSFVFIGNSITHQCLYTQYIEDYFITRYPDKKINFINGGVSGDFASDVLVRLQDDILVHTPKYVTILIGMNDGMYMPWQDSIFTRYKKDMIKMFDLLKAAGIQPILLTPTLFDTQQALKGETEFETDYATNLHYDATLSYFGAWCAEAASQYGFGFVDLHGDMTYFTRKKRHLDPDFTLVPDAIHPEENGQFIMAWSILKEIEPDPIVSEIQIIKNQNNEWEYHTKNGDILNASTDEISFEFKARALPWVVPDEASMAYELTNAGSILSRETVQVIGLTSGQYEILIDDNLVGVYSHIELAAGIELQNNTNTPQYKQALEVALLNQERNEKYVSRLRNHWLLRKELWQVKNNLFIEEEEDFDEEEDEDLEELSFEDLSDEEKLEIEEDEKEEKIFSEAHEVGYDKYLEESFKERNKLLEQNSEFLLDKIRSINKPIILHYSIRSKK